MGHIPSSRTFLLVRLILADKRTFVGYTSLSSTTFLSADTKNKIIRNTSYCILRMSSCTAKSSRGESFNSACAIYVRTIGSHHHIYVKHRAVDQTKHLRMINLAYISPPFDSSQLWDIQLSGQQTEHSGRIKFTFSYYSHLTFLRLFSM
jgi:hypothetical protein